MTAQEWYEQGNAFRKESKWHIMAFYCKDMYNP